MKLSAVVVINFFIFIVPFFTKGYARCRCFSEEVKQVSSPAAPCTAPPYNTSLKQLYKFPYDPHHVKYTMTFVADDLVEMYVDGKLILKEDDFPKRRYTFQYKGPCSDILVLVTNASPRMRPFGGAGIGILINYKHVVYGSAAINTYQACAPPVCADESAVNVKPIFGTGKMAPNPACFTDSSKCDFNSWLPLTVHDTLFDFPLCEFVDMGRLGGIPVNPRDGLIPDLVQFAIRFQLPFCNT